MTPREQAIACAAHGPYPPRFVPRTPTLASYRYLFVAMPFLRFFLNSLLLSSATVVATIAAASLAAYVINRRRFPGREVFFVLFLVCMMLPGLTNIIPMYLLMGRLRLINTYLSIILLYTSGNVAFSIWLLRGFFSAIPRELDEAAIFDGCSPFTLLRLIILPLTLPGIIATAVLVFINCWNEFLVALTFTNKELMRTLTVAIYYFRTYWTVRWGEIMAASIVTITPVLVLFGVMQRYRMETAKNDALGFPLHYLAGELVPRMLAIVYLHGFTGCRDSHLDVRMELADLGFLVVSFDASRHGERGALPDFWNSCRTTFLPTFARVLAETSDDVVRVVRTLRGDRRVDGERIGLVGGSMGGMACLMTVPRCAGLRVAVSMAGTVDFLRWIGETSGPALYDSRAGRIDGELRTLLREYDAIHHLDGFAPVPLLLVHGGKDDLVPPRGQRELAEKLAPYYAGQPSRLRFSLYPDLAHETSPALLAEVHQWLREFL